MGTVGKSVIDSLNQILSNDFKQFDKTILVLNDIHLPFERDDVLQVIKRHVDEIDVLVLGGDTLDCFSISQFPKVEHLTLVEEIQYAYDFFIEIEKILNGKPIVTIMGNHEERLYSEIKRLNSKHLQPLMNPFILEMFSDGFYLYPNGRKKYYEPIKTLVNKNSWFVNIDKKVIVAHPKNFSRVKGKYLENIASYFINQGEQFELIIGTHTHKFAMADVDRYMGVYVIEAGCMCKPMEYANSGKLGYTPQHYCYTIIRYNFDEPLNINDQTVIHLPKTEEEVKYDSQLDLR